MFKIHANTKTTPGNLLSPDGQRGISHKLGSFWVVSRWTSLVSYCVFGYIMCVPVSHTMACESCREGFVPLSDVYKVILPKNQCLEAAAYDTCPQTHNTTNV